MPAGIDGGQMWVESSSGITPFRLPAGAEPNQLPHVASGVAVSSFSRRVGSVELWHLRQYQWRDVPAPLFRRSLSFDGRSVRFPVGQAISIGRDSHDGIIAVSAPMTIEAGSCATAAPESLGRSLVVVLRLPHPTSAAAVRLVVDDGTPDNHPDVFAAGADALIAVWYALKPGRAEVRFSAPDLIFPTRQVVIDPSRTAAIEGEARAAPKLTVDVTLAGNGDHPPISLTVSAVDPPVDRTVPIRGPGRFVVDALPAAALKVMLRVGVWRFARDADLSSGRDGTVNFDLHPVTVRGKVLRAGKPMHARVSFAGDDLYDTTTDDDGRYEIRLWHRRRYAVYITVSDGGGRPYLDTVHVNDDMQFDVDIPSGSFSASVVDAADGRAIAQARVTMTNDWNDPESGSRRVMTQISVGEDGKASLPPLRPGVLRLRADAAGYGSEEREYPITGTEGIAAPFEIALKALGHTRAIHMALPDGTPAVGAEVFAVSSTQKIVFSAATDEKGLVELPEDLRGVFLIARHPATASDIQPVESSFENDTWRLPRLAPPLAIHVLSVSSEPLRSAAAFLWTPCCRIEGLTLALFARTASVTSSDGTWTASSLPAAPLKIVFVNSRDAAAAESGAYDQLATPIAYPWPAVMTIVGH